MARKVQDERSPQTTTEMQPLNKTGNPIPRGHFRKVLKNDNVPDEDEFEKLYKKDIDKFIDGSDFEVESLAGFSEISKGTFKSAV